MFKTRYQQEIFRDKSGEFRWRIRHGNGNIIAVSGEGYKRLGPCRRMLCKVARGVIKDPDKVSITYCDVTLADSAIETRRS